MVTGNLQLIIGQEIRGNHLVVQQKRKPKHAQHLFVTILERLKKHILPLIPLKYFNDYNRLLNYILNFDVSLTAQGPVT